MIKCLVCGKENEGWLCTACETVTDKEKLCNEFCVYNIGKGENENWNSFADFINNDVAFEITDYLCGNLCDCVKVYYRILYLAKNNRYIRKNDVDIFLNMAEKVLECNDVTADKKNRIRGLLLDVYTNNIHDYIKAEEMANILLNETELPKYAINSMVIFFKNTRRYDVAEKLIKEFLSNNSGDSYCAVLEKEYDDLKKRRDGLKVEYIPKEDADKEKYFTFLETLGFKIEKECKEDTPVKTNKKLRGIPKPIPRDEYPAPQKAEGTVFNDFVAFDVETTGTDGVRDSIIELSAVKVRNGEIVETFSELVRPIDKKVSDEITALTGITNDEVQNAREIWEVFPDFVNFIGDDVLLGYNTVAFDSQFLVRAGRYSRIIIQNKHFDVMHYSRAYLKQYGIKNVIPLVKLGEMLDIENPQAHRALADAETTAKIYLKLVEKIN